MNTRNPVEAATSTPAASTAPERGPAGPAEATFDRAAAPHPGGHQAGQVQATPRQDHPTNPSRGVNGPTSPTHGTKDHPKQDRHPRTARRAAPLLAHPQARLWATAVLAGALWITVLLWTFTKGPTS